MNTCKEIVIHSCKYSGSLPQTIYVIQSPRKVMKFIVQINYWTMGSSGDSAITMQFADVLHNMSLTVVLPWQQTAF